MDLKFSPIADIVSPQKLSSGVKEIFCSDFLSASRNCLPSRHAQDKSDANDALVF
jgi:hypothetical protein